MPKTSKQKQWETEHPDKVRQYRQAYEYRNRVDRKEDKKAWWRKNKGRYGTRKTYEDAMRATGGKGWEAGYNRPLSKAGVKAMHQAQRTKRRGW